MVGKAAPIGLSTNLRPHGTAGTRMASSTRLSGIRPIGIAQGRKVADPAIGLLPSDFYPPTMLGDLDDLGGIRWKPQSETSW